VNYLTRSLPALGVRRLSGIWLLVLAVSVLYCWLSEYVHGHAIGSLPRTLRWAVEQWSGWILISALFVFRIPQTAFLERVWQHRRGWVAVLIASPLITLAIEWHVHLLFGWLGEPWSGGMPQRESFWLLVYERAPLCVVGSAVLAVAHWVTRDPGRTSVPRAARSVTRSAAATSLTNGTSASPVVEQALTIITPRGPLQIPASEIEALIAAENYVAICLRDGTQHLQRATLQSMGATLATSRMVRIRRSVIINTDHLTARLPGGKLRLASGRIVQIGRTYRGEVDAQLSALPPPGKPVRSPRTGAV
jgi:hypothetical protein